jgi:hypothetical protein
MTVDNPKLAATLMEYAATIERTQDLCWKLRQTIMRSRALSAELKALCDRQAASRRQQDDD